VAGSLVVHIPYPAVAAVADKARLDAISPGVEVLTVPYEIGHDQRVRREQDPLSDATQHGEPALTTEQAEAFARCDVVLSLDAPLDIPRVAPRLRWIQAIGSGVGQYQACRLPSTVTLTNGAGIGAPPIAEWVIGRILQIYKSFPLHDARARDRHWEMALGSLFMGQTVSVIGLGAIGNEVAVRARPFGVKLLGVRRSYRAGMTSPYVDELFGPDSLDEVLARSDVVVLAAPGTSENESMFDDARFAAMKPGSVFVNVARGTLVDEAALIDALKSGHLRAAALDVMRHEPMATDDPLWDAPNVLISPHSSASGEGYMERAFDLFARNLERFVKGEPLVNVVDLSGGY
jgi:phosphoglycerate dehydrogenase-like enzyme